MNISVVIAARNGSAPVLHALDSLARLTHRSSLEVIVANAAGEEAAARIRGRFPGQTMVPVPPTATVMQARAAGVERCTGAVIAILNERYTVDDAWLAAVNAPENTGLVATGPVAPRAGYTSSEWAMYLTEYSHLAPPLLQGPVEPGQAALLPGGNIAYPRDAFPAAAMAKATSEAAFHQSLQAAGVRFVRDNRMRVEFGFPNTPLEYLLERREVSRESARQLSIGWGPGHRALAALFRLALPPLLWQRTLRLAWRKPLLRAALFRASPQVVFFSLVQTRGEWEGFLFPSSRGSGTFP